jgi:hypothetical protein
MKKTLLILFIFIAVILIFAFFFSTLFVTEKKSRYQDCILLQNSQTKAVDCFGCYNNICKDAPQDWVIYTQPEVGIPYACFKSEQGCQLAQ